MIMRGCVLSFGDEVQSGNGCTNTIFNEGVHSFLSILGNNEEWISMNTWCYHSQHFKRVKGSCENGHVLSCFLRAWRSPINERH